MMLGALVVASLTVGCGDKCKSLCDVLKDCPQGSQAPPGATCDKYCDDANKVSDAAKCNSQKDDVYDCQDKMQDKCDTTDHSCEDKEVALGTCISNYCQMHATDSVCTTFYADFKTSAN